MTSKATLWEWAWEQDLPAADKMVLMTLVKLADADGLNCWPSQKAIAEKAGVARSTVQAVLARLEKAGYVKRSSRHRENGSTTSNEYLVQGPARETGTPCPADEHPQPGKQAPPTSQSGTHNKQTNKLSLRKDIALEGFEDWYSEYPRKKSRGAAEKAFKKAIQLVPLADLIERTKRFAAHWASRPPDDLRFCPYPASWLNSKGWLDQENASSDEPSGIERLREKYHITAPRADDDTNPFLDKYGISPNCSDQERKAAAE